MSRAENETEIMLTVEGREVEARSLSCYRCGIDGVLCTTEDAQIETREGLVCVADALAERDLAVLVADAGRSGEAVCEDCAWILDQAESPEVETVSATGPRITITQDALGADGGDVARRHAEHAATVAGYAILWDSEITIRETREVRVLRYALAPLAGRDLCDCGLVVHGDCCDCGQVRA